MQKLIDWYFHNFVRESLWSPPNPEWVLTSDHTAISMVLAIIGLSWMFLAQFFTALRYAFDENDADLSAKNGWKVVGISLLVQMSGYFFIFWIGTNIGPIAWWVLGLIVLFIHGMVAGPGRESCSAFGFTYGLCKYYEKIETIEKKLAREFEQYTAQLNKRI